MPRGTEIFDRGLLHERQARAVRRLPRHDEVAGMLPDFLLKLATGDVIERLSMINRVFARVVSIGSYHGEVARRLKAHGVAHVIETDAVAELLQLGLDRETTIASDEEALPLADDAFDLAVSVLSLQYVNDLPAVLSRIQQTLRPDGLFVGVLLGGSTLRELRQVMLEAEMEVRGGASPRVIPFVDVRDAGALLQRAGFALPVADTEVINVSYASALDLMRELKSMGATNVLHERTRTPMTRGLLVRAAEIYAEKFPADDGAGRVNATFELLTLTGWSPDPSQQKPLRPGSAQVSLADALKPRT